MAERHDRDYEEQRAFLRQQAREADRRAHDPKVIRQEKLERSGRIRDIIAVITLFLVLALAIIFYAENYSYTTYSLDFELGEETLTGARLYAFKDGCVAVTRDSVSFVSGDAVRFTNTCAYQTPVVKAEGDFFTVFDRGGYQIRIYDESGLTGTVRLTRKVYAVDISASGVLAVFTESSEAAYISYFDRFGNRISVEVRTIPEESGYPVDIDISPDGQRLAVSFFAAESGSGLSRLVVYDFDKGKADAQYAVYRSEDADGQGTYLSDVFFVSDSLLYAAGEDRLVFLNFDAAGSASANTLIVEDPIISVFAAGNFLGAVTETAGGHTCTVYRENGEIYSRFEVPEGYEHLAANARYLTFTNGTELYFYNISGRKRYEGALTDDVDSVVLTGRRSLLMSTGSYLEKITLK